MVFINYIVTPEQRFVKRGEKDETAKIPGYSDGGAGCRFIAGGAEHHLSAHCRRRTGEHSGTWASPDSGKVGAKVYEKDFRKGLVKNRNLWYHHTPNERVWLWEVPYGFEPDSRA